MFPIRPKSRITTGSRFEILIGLTLSGDALCCYRFVYIGKSGSFTPYHKDVLSSYSWSVNVMGAKEWLFVRPGSEASLGIVKSSETIGDYPADVSANLPLETSSDMFRLEQKAGNAIFVPSNWHHQNQRG